MDMVSFAGPMGRYTMANFRTIGSMEKENIFGMIRDSMKVNGKRGKCMEWVNIDGQMVRFMKACLKMILNTGMVFWSGILRKSGLGNGLREKCMVKEI